MIEHNIRAIQQRIQALESSFHDITPEIIEDMPPEQIYPIQNLSVREISAHDSRMYRSDIKGPQTQAYTRSNRKSLARGRRQDPEEEAEEQDYNPNQKVIEELLKEIDFLKQKSNQQEMKIETLNFRCDKLQNELSLKLDIVNKQALELEDKSSAIRNQASQIHTLEKQIEQDKRTIIPQLQKTKSQYDICLLEMKSLENDNEILENHIKQLSETNSVLRNDNRDLRNVNSKIEMERLTLKKEIEDLKNKFYNYEDEIEDLSVRFEEKSTENERMKNEIGLLNQKVEVMSSEKAIKYGIDRSEKQKEEYVGTYGRENVHAQKFNTTFVSNGIKENDESFNLVARKKNQAEARVAPPKNFLSPMDKLNFEGINNIEERFRKLNQN
jgi:chromosome segregation ATPase